MLSDAVAAESAGFRSFWFPQVPGYLDAMTAVALVGTATGSIEIGTAVVPIQTRHPVIMAQQALTTQAACAGRFTLGIGPSHDWIINGQLGLSYDRPVALMRDYLDVLLAGCPLRARWMSTTPSSPCTARWMSPIRRCRCCWPRWVRTMLRIAGERADGTILWMADERAIGEHVAPRINAAAEAAGRGRPRVVAGVPVTLCAPADVDDARAHASEVLGHAHLSPNYLRLLEHGDARDVGDTAGRRRRDGSRTEPAALPGRGCHRSGRTDRAARRELRSPPRIAAPHDGVPGVTGAVR